MESGLGEDSAVGRIGDPLVGEIGVEGEMTTGGVWIGIERAGTSGLVCATVGASSSCLGEGEGAVERTNDLADSIDAKESRVADLLPLVSSSVLH